MVRYITPILSTVIGIIMLISAINLPKSNLGNPNGPMYFPLMIAIILILSGIVYFFQEFKARGNDFLDFRALRLGKSPMYLLASLVLMLIYTVLFERIGFLFSTILFLGGLLFLLNGRKKWMSNIIIAVAFSFITWYAFGTLLQVSLP
ncbi:tripartite tricarboxylate transporter TctB family protein [Sporosarcina sp. P26b]|uniref:tripartite tricarboxylate transporter TctB family protein n=1 Tax=Sporosarcina TaxID=1569 RepID=UPI000A17DFAA|nr:MULTISPECIES: tripartite tricarboxylate transporter TctB family protein [Sporosarcina]ARK21288.1 tripartite tricarboxylate transporter TctB family protein [Sporosarcina ureae]PIC73412.1 tripartite tricarboxylate transporter TctB family protein [Sporosarcina sp. P17b]PIC95459.1 tripartite tricarboxylate transporter TctB family protein [Sporosarcina sp. P26b]